ncbi:MAG: DUF2628 domain-containing protein [Oscillospiraceae bacterium]|nr:DUF2628 domain-containing protein [Oscillospiraceae bacterium]
MINYTGKKCLACGQIFDENDDIVVCPDCGTPYHRLCFRKSGCVNTELHRTHGSWQASEDESSSDYPECKKCGARLREGAIFCDKCGSPVAPGRGVYRPVDPAAVRPEYGDDLSQGFEDGLGGFATYTARAQDVLDEDVTVGEVSEFVGANKQYYVPRFVMMNKFNMKMSFNIAAFLFPEAYFAYRKMYLQAILVFLIRSIIMLPSTAAAMCTLLSDDTYYKMFATMLEGYPVLVQKLQIFASIGAGASSSANSAAGALTGLSTLSSFLNMLLEIGLCLFANSFYYRYCISSVAALKADSKGALIPQLGGTSVPGLIIFLLLTFVRLYASMFLLLAIV